MSAPYSELETPLTEWSLVCRGCLANSGEMKNMFDWGLSEDFIRLSEVQMKKTESISQLICESCEKILMSFKEFKAQCQNNDILLRKMAQSAPDSNEELINVTTTILHEKKLIIMIIAPVTEAKIILTCPYHCTDTFTKKNDLYAHLIKVHNTSREFVIELQYYCCVETCSYHISSDKNKWFSARKFYNQHYNKVHRQKIYQCDACKSSFSIVSALNRHLRVCKNDYVCKICSVKYKTNEKLLVHLLRRHPEMHKKYKEERKAEKRKSKNEDDDSKRVKIDVTRKDFICDSPKRTLATQIPENITNDVTLLPWTKTEFETRTDEISTQTVFEDLLSLKSQNSEDEIFFSETVSLSDIQTQTFPDFSLTRSNKETQSTSESPDFSIKETQTCVCHYDSPKPNFKLFDSLSSSPASINLTSTETQTAENRFSVKNDVLLSFNSAETQTCFDESSNDSM